MFIPNLQDPADMKTGRHVNPDHSVSPIRDTGFRMKPTIPVIYNPPVRQESVVALPAGYVHQDDVIYEGPAIIRRELINAVRLISVNTESHAAREAKYLSESIAARRKREAKEN